MQGIFPNKREKSSRKRAVTSQYVSPNQLTFCGFETPFEQQLSKTNRWVKLSNLIPWDKIVKHYDSQFKSLEGRPPINGRVVIGSVIIKHILNLTDRETILQIQENMFMQYFIGFSTFTNEEPFSHTLFGSIRSRLSLEVMDKINAVIASVNIENVDNDESNDSDKEGDVGLDTPPEGETTTVQLPENKGTLLMDATVAPQYITFPTDLKLLNACREKTEEIINKIFVTDIHISKPRTYKRIARKEFLNVARKKNKKYKEIYEANGSQIRYVARNLRSVEAMLDVTKVHSDFIAFPLSSKDLEYIETIKLIHAQQLKMHETQTHSIADRIVNLHQPHVRPIVRGKEGKKVEFGSKLQVALVDGFTFLDKLSWNSFNEGTCLKDSIEKYKNRYGYYPMNVLADKIYCNRINRQYLKSLGITLKAKPLGRPSKNEALSNQVSPGERNPIEGKFGQGKVGYGLNSIGAKLQCTSESWIASIILVLNLVNLTRRVLVSILHKYLKLTICFFGIHKPAFSL
jgi:transposase, IS5 family